MPCKAKQGRARLSCPQGPPPDAMRVYCISLWVRNTQRITCSSRQPKLWMGEVASGSCLLLALENTWHRHREGFTTQFRFRRHKVSSAVASRHTADMRSLLFSYCCSTPSGSPTVPNATCSRYKYNHVSNCANKCVSYPLFMSIHLRTWSNFAHGNASCTRC